MQREARNLIAWMLRLMRTASDKNQTSVARALGYQDASFAARIESGRVTLTTNLIQDWIDATGGIRVLDRIEEGCRQIRVIHSLGRQPLRFA